MIETPFLANAAAARGGVADGMDILNFFTLIVWPACLERRTCVEQILLQPGDLGCV